MTTAQKGKIKRKEKTRKEKHKIAGPSCTVWEEQRQDTSASGNQASNVMQGNEMMCHVSQ